MTQQKKEISTLLAESFRTLAAEKPIEKITIKEITDGAGVIRVTFYNHFQNIDKVKHTEKQEIKEGLRRHKNTAFLCIRKAAFNTFVIFLSRQISHSLSCFFILRTSYFAVLFFSCVSVMDIKYARYVTMAWASPKYWAPILPPVAPPMPSLNTKNWESLR